AYLNGVQRVGGSNPLAPTSDYRGLAVFRCPLFRVRLMFSSNVFELSTVESTGNDGIESGAFGFMSSTIAPHNIFY
ncbi:MAG: hypothetical protein L7F78_25955, partial [Syntrophales bacterium LBB04]|nr:hypothetical protein [Syntrophales bacterium LBB04]